MKPTQQDQIIREIPLIARYSRHNEDSDHRFRTYLKVGSNLSNKELDAAVQKMTDEVWKEIDCTTCANCCKSLQIVVDDTDIRRLAARLDISSREFSKKYIREDADKTKYFAATPCAFLGTDNRCTVYEDRPKPAGTFPIFMTPAFGSGLSR